MHRIFTIVIVLLSVSFSLIGKEQSVWVKNSAADIELAGTLSLPTTETPKAFLLLISGSGAQNRDEEVFGHRPFKILADTLTSAGYGVLRLDDRGTGESQGVYEDATLNDFLTDAEAAVKYLREEYPESHIGLLGHSQGGEIAVMAASHNKEPIDFIITLAAPAWPGDSLIMSQCRALAVATTGSWPGESLERRLLDIAKSDISPTLAKPMLMQAFSSSLGDIMSVPQVQQQVWQQIQPLLSPMYRGLLRYDPTDDIKNVKVPWLALNGDKDFQVLQDNLKTINELNPMAKVLILKGHNHLFQHAVTGLPDEYSTAGQSPSEETLTSILEFLDQIFPSKN